MAYGLEEYGDEMYDALYPAYQDFQQGTVDPYKAYLWSMFTQQPIVNPYSDRIESAQGDLDKLNSYNLKNRPDNMGVFEYFRTYPEREKQKSELSASIEDMMKRSEAFPTGTPTLGYTEDQKNEMFKQASGQIHGARSSFQKDLGKTMAAQGMTQTGAPVAAMKSYDTNMGRDLSGAKTNIEVADAEAKRADKWNALSGYNTGMATDLQNRSSLEDMYNMISQLKSQSANIEAGKDANSFWNNIKSSFGRSIGTGFGTWG
jgi:hypothetical protein